MLRMCQLGTAALVRAFVGLEFFAHPLGMCVCLDVAARKREGRRRMRALTCTIALLGAPFRFSRGLNSPAC